MEGVQDPAFLYTATGSGGGAMPAAMGGVSKWACQHCNDAHRGECELCHLPRSH